jgi:serine/threonine-protein kinase
VRDPFQLVGTTIDRKYRVDRVIGEGGFGVVYQGTHAILGQPLAIKCLKPLGGARDDEARLTELFLREARVLFSLGHPGIVRLYDVGSVASSIWVVPYVVLEYLEGPTLEAELEDRVMRGRGPLGAAELLAIFGPVLEAVAFAHEAGVVHRDLKPSNVMLVRTPAGVSAKVVDFGIARRTGDARASSSVTGFTPRYAAPEQWDPATFGPGGAATDVFALGLMIAEACTLRPVLEAAGPAAALAKLLDPARSLRVREVRPDLPPALDGALERATRLRPEERFRDARALHAALTAALRAPSQSASSSMISNAPTEWSPLSPTRPSSASPGSAPPGTFAPAAASPVAHAPLAPLAPLPAYAPVPPTSGPYPAPSAALRPRAEGASRMPLLVALIALVVALAAVGAFALMAMSSGARKEASASTSPNAPNATSAPKALKTPIPAPEPGAPNAAETKDEIDQYIDDELRRALGPAASASPRAPTGKGPSIEVVGVLGEAAPNTQKSVTTVVEKHVPALRTCYEKALARDPSVQGRLTLMLSLGKDGKVSNAMCAQNAASITDGPLRNCASAEASEWKFKVPSDGIGSFMVTVEFWP